MPYFSAVSSKLSFWLFLPYPFSDPFSALFSSTSFSTEPSFPYHSRAFRPLISLTLFYLFAADASKFLSSNRFLFWPILTSAESVRSFEVSLPTHRWLDLISKLTYFVRAWSVSYLWAWPICVFNLRRSAYNLPTSTSSPSSYFVSSNIISLLLSSNIIINVSLINLQC